MAFCDQSDDTFDIFFSYANDDNQLTNGFIDDFYHYFKKQLRLKLHYKTEGNYERLRIYFDKAGLPETGSLSKNLNETLQKTYYLFIFVGLAYFRSEWCLHEFESFRNRFGGVAEDAARHTRLIILNRDAIEQCNKDTPPPRIAPEFWELAKPLRTQVIHNCRFEAFIDSDGKLLPVWENHKEERPCSQFRDAAEKLLEAVTSNLEHTRCKITRAEQAQSAVKPLRRESGEAPLVLIGPVPPRLDPATQALKDAFSPWTCRVVDTREIRDRSPELKETVGKASAIIQPFDDGPVLVCKGRRYDPAGGHLALFYKLVNECQSDVGAAGRAPFLWWSPPMVPRDRPGVQKNQPRSSWAADELDSEDREFIRGLARSTCRFSASDLALSIKQSFSDDNTIGEEEFHLEIWVETREDRRQEIKQILTFLEDMCEKSKERESKTQFLLKQLHIDFYPYDWSVIQDQSAKIKEGEVPAPSGIILLFDEKVDRKQMQTRPGYIRTHILGANQRAAGVAKLVKEVIEIPTHWYEIEFEIDEAGNVNCNQSELENFLGVLFQCGLKKIARRRSNSGLVSRDGVDYA